MATIIPSEVSSGGGGGTPGAPEGSIQFNRGGSFAGNANLVFDGTNTLTLGNNLHLTSVGRFTIGGPNGSITDTAWLTADGASYTLSFVDVNNINRFTLQTTDTSTVLSLKDTGGVTTISLDGGTGIATARTFAGQLAPSYLDGFPNDPTKYMAGDGQWPPFPSGGLGTGTTLLTQDPLTFSGSLASGTMTLILPASSAIQDGYQSSTTFSFISNRASSALTLTAGFGLSGGGTLAADRSFDILPGTSATTLCIGNDSRLSDSRTPTGAAGGDLTGTYPNPTLGTITLALTAGGSSQTLTIQRDAQGRNIGMTATSILIGEAQVTGLVADLADKVGTSLGFLGTGGVLVNGSSSTVSIGSLSGLSFDTTAAFAGKVSTGATLTVTSSGTQLVNGATSTTVIGATGTLALSNATGNAYTVLSPGIATGTLALTAIKTLINPMKFQLSPGSAEITGASTDPLLVGVAGTNTNWSELQYNDTTDQNGRFVISDALTNNYEGGLVSVQLRWRAAATTGNVLWRVSMLALTTNGQIDTAYNTTVHTLASAANTTTGLLSTSLLTFTPVAAELTAGQLLLMQIARIASSSTDTMVGDAKLIMTGVWE